MNRIRFSRNHPHSGLLFNILAPFTTLMNEIAEAWNIIFVVGAEEPDDPTPEGGPDFVAFNFCTAETAKTEEKIASLFGYAHEMRYWHNGSYPFYYALKYNPGRLLDFNPLAAISYARMPPGIFIMTDSFAERWEGDMDVLAIELMVTLAHIFGHDTARMRTAGEVLTRAIQSRSLSLAATTRAQFLSWRRMHSERVMQRIEEEVTKNSQAMTIIEGDQLKLLEEIAAQERYLAEIPSRVMNDDMRREEFRKLMQLNGMARIEITQSAIIAFTHTLIQRYPPPIDRKPQTNYDIGGYRIRLEFANFARTSLTLTQYIVGRHRNAYIGMGTTPCFGTELNPRIDKLIADCKIVPLFALVLSFLRVAGQPVEILPPSKEPSKDVPGMDPASGEYALTRDAYVQLVNGVLLKRAQANLELTLRTSRAAELALSQRYITTRLTGTNLYDQYREYERAWPHIESDMQSEFERIQTHPLVIGITVTHGLQLWLYDRELLPYPTILWLHDTFGPRLVSPFGILSGALNDHRLNSYAPHMDAYRQFMQDIAAGHYYEALESVRAWIIERKSIIQWPIVTSTAPQPSAPTNYYDPY